MRRTHTWLGAVETLYWKTFVTVAELGSFSRAAERLCITQSAVSRRIAALETNYGLRLLDRAAGSVSCSEAGRLVLDTARGILALEHKIAGELCDFEGHRALSMGCSPNFSATVLPALLALIPTLGEKFHLAVTMEPTEDLLDGFGNGLFDVAFFEHCSADGLDQEHVVRLREDPVIFVSSPSCRLTEGELPASALLRHVLYCCSARCCTRWLLESGLARTGLTVSAFRQVVEVTDINLLKRGLIENEGVAFVSFALVAEDVAQGRLVPHRVAGFQQCRELVLVARNAELLRDWAGFFHALSPGNMLDGPWAARGCGAT